MMMIILIVMVIAIIVMFTFALCRTAAEADRQNERMFAQYRKEKAHEAAQHAAGTAPAIHEG